MSDNEKVRAAREYAEHHGIKPWTEHIFNVLDALEAAEQNLAAAQAVIAEAKAIAHGPFGPWDDDLCDYEVLSQSPADALQAAKEAAWGEGARHVYAEGGKCSFARDGDPCPYNPYRKDKADE